jgi:hypothetical protein
MGELIVLRPQIMPIYFFSAPAAFLRQHLIFAASARQFLLSDALSRLTIFSNTGRRQFVFILVVLIMMTSCLYSLSLLSY